MQTFRFDRAFGAMVLSLAATFAFAQGPAPAAKPAPMPVTSVKIAGHPLKVEVANTHESRSRGLMFRESMPPDDGMLFIFEDVGYHSMWMRNTPLPLSVAFIDSEGKILNILDMQPRTDDTHTAAGPARYAIETNIGWFAKKKIRAGDKVTGLPPAK